MTGRREPLSLPSTRHKDAGQALTLWKARSLDCGGMLRPPDRQACGLAPFRRPASIPAPGTAAVPSSRSMSAAAVNMEAGETAFTNTRGEVRFADGFVQGGTDGDGSAKSQIRVVNTAALNLSDSVLKRWGRSESSLQLAVLTRAWAMTRSWRRWAGFAWSQTVQMASGSVGSRIKRLATSVWSAAATASSVS